MRKTLGPDQNVPLGAVWSSPHFLGKYFSLSIWGDLSIYNCLFIYVCQSTYVVSHPVTCDYEVWRLIVLAAIGCHRMPPGQVFWDQQNNIVCLSMSLKACNSWWYYGQYKVYAILYVLTHVIMHNQYHCLSLFFGPRIVHSNPIKNEGESSCHLIKTNSLD